MFSTPIVMKEVPDLNSVPVSASDADDMRARVNVANELGNRFTYAELFGLASVLVLLLLLQFVPHILSWLGRPNPRLTNLASIALIIGTSIALGGVLVALVRQLRK